MRESGTESAQQHIILFTGTKEAADSWSRTVEKTFTLHLMVICFSNHIVQTSTTFHLYCVVLSVCSVVLYASWRRSTDRNVLVIITLWSATTSSLTFFENYNWWMKTISMWMVPQPVNKNVTFSGNRCGWSCSFIWYINNVVHEWKKFGQFELVRAPL